MRGKWVEHHAPPTEALEIFQDTEREATLAMTDCSGSHALGV
jgi:hypothetical protein